MRLRAAALWFGIAGNLFGADVLTVSSGQAERGSTAQVAVRLRDVSGTSLGEDQTAANGIRGFAFRITATPAGSVSSISFTRGGVLAPAPLYERVVTGTATVGFIASYAENAAVDFSLDAIAPGDLIGFVSVGISPGATGGSSISLTIDPARAILSNATGTVAETTSNGGLQIVNGTITVQPAATATALTSSLNPSTRGGNVTFTATVTSAVAGTPTGNVEFRDGTSMLATVALSGGQASYTTSSLTAGSHSITAHYAGDGDFAASASGVLTQTVNTPFGAPEGLTATATSTTRIVTSWLPVSNADHYDVYRRTDGAAFAVHATVTTPFFEDTPVVAGKTYLYSVVAVTASGTASPASAVDAATTIVFADDPLTAGVLVKATHLTQLRDAVNAFRTAVGLSPVTFTGSLAGAVIRATHVQELRDALAAARTMGSTPPVTYTDDPLTAGTVIKAVHVRQLRSAVQ